MEVYLYRTNTTLRPKKGVQASLGRSIETLLEEDDIHQDITHDWCFAGLSNMLIENTKATIKIVNLLNVLGGMIELYNKYFPPSEAALTILE